MSITRDLETKGRAMEHQSNPTSTTEVATSTTATRTTTAGHASRRWVGALVAGAAIGMLAVGAVAVIDSDNTPGPTPANAQTPPNTSNSGSDAGTSPVRTVTVSAEGKATVKPDTATIYLGVSVNAKTANEALQRAAEKADALIATLKASGVADDDIQTSGLSLYPQYDSSGRTITGYNVSNTVTAKIRNIDTAGTVIDAATAYVGDEITIGGISFSVENDDAALADARKQAMADAKLRAEQYTSAAEASVGQVLSIDESQSSGYQPFPTYQAAAADNAAGASTPIATGTTDIVVNVTVTFELVS